MSDQEVVEAFTRDLIALAGRHACRVHVHRSDLGEIRVRLQLNGADTLVQLWGLVELGMTDKERNAHLNRLSEILREGMTPMPRFGPKSNVLFPTKEET